jgi:hypothetical protein
VPPAPSTFSPFKTAPTHNKAENRGLQWQNALENSAKMSVRRVKRVRKVKRVKRVESGNALWVLI